MRGLPCGITPAFSCPITFFSVRMAAEAFGLAANIAAVFDLLIKVGIQCSIYCADVKTAPRDVRYINNEIDRFGATLKDVKRLLNGPNCAVIEASKNLRRGVEDCKLQLAHLAAKLEEGNGVGWKRLTWPLKKGEANGLVQKLEQCRTAISLDLKAKQTYVGTVLAQAVTYEYPENGPATFGRT